MNKIVNGQPIEVGMAGTMSDKEYYAMMARPLNDQSRNGEKVARAAFVNMFGAELAALYCK